MNIITRDYSVLNISLFVHKNICKGYNIFLFLFLHSTSICVEWKFLLGDRVQLYENFLISRLLYYSNVL